MVTLKTEGGGEFVSVVQTGDGYMCRNEPILHFGLGAADSIESVTIRWPSGKTETHGEFPTKSRWLVIEDHQTGIQELR